MTGTERGLFGGLGPPRAGAPIGGGARKLRAADALWPLGLCAVIAVTVSFHELAHDEAQAWNIARSAELPWQVLRHGRNEGHTPLWYLLLWPFTRTGEPLWMHALSGLLVAGVAVQLFRDRPFARIGCALVVFSYPFVYDYSTIARPYALALALAALYGSLMRRGDIHLVVLALVCGSIAMTSAFGVVLSAPLMLVAALESFSAERHDGWRTRLAASLVYGAFALSSVAFILLPFAVTEFEQAMVGGERASLGGISLTLTTSAFPHLNQIPLQIGEWATRSSSGRLVTLIAASVVALSVGVRLAGRPSALLGWLGCLAAVSGAVAFSGATEERHLGHLFIGAVALLWARDGLRWGVAARPHDLPVGVRRGADAVLVLVLLYQCLVGLGAVSFDVRVERTPFRDAARLLESRFGSEGSILNDYDYPAIPLLAYLDREAWHNDCGCVTRYSRWDLRRPHDFGTLLERWCEALKRDEDTLVITGRSEALGIPGVALLAEYPPGHRDTTARPAYFVAATQAAGVCGARAAR